MLLDHATGTMTNDDPMFDAGGPGARFSSGGGGSRMPPGFLGGADMALDAALGGGFSSGGGAGFSSGGGAGPGALLGGGDGAAYAASAGGSLFGGMF